MHAPCPVTPFGGPSAVPLLVRCASGSCPCSASKAKGALASNLTFFQVRGNFCHASRLDGAFQATWPRLASMAPPGDDSGENAACVGVLEAYKPAPWAWRDLC